MEVPAHKIGMKENEFDPQRQVRLIDRLDKVNTYANNFLGWLAGGSLMLIVFIVVINAIVRTFYKPFVGTTEVVGWLAALTIAFALGFTQNQKGYVDIDAFVRFFPTIVQRIIKILVDAISLSFFTMVAWKMIEYSLAVAQNGNLSETMGIPYYHIITLVAVGFIGLSFAILIDLLRQVVGGESI